MTPLPIIDAVTPKAGRETAKGDITTSLEPAMQDDVMSFASIFAADAVPEEKLAPEIAPEIATQPDEEVIAEDDVIAELALAETTKTRNDPELPVPAAKDASNALQPVIDRMRGKQAQPLTRMELPVDAGTIERPAPERRASLVQRMVEGQMPTTAKVAIPAAPTPTKGEHAASRPTIAVPTTDQAVPIETVPDIVRRPLVETAETSAKAATQDKATAVLALVEGEEKRTVDPKEPKPISPEQFVELRQTPKANTTIGSAMPMAPANTVPNQPADDRQKAIAGATLGDAEVPQTLAATERSQLPAVQQATTASATYGADTARHAAQQLAAHVTQHPGRMTEIALNPEELGRVRLAMTAVDAAITLSVLAERPETVDLLRRHIDVLAQEFRALGYEDISFSFGDERPADDDPAPETEHFSGENNQELDPPIQPAMGPVSGLDLRL